MLVLGLGGLLVYLLWDGEDEATVAALGDSYTVAIRSGPPCAPDAACPQNSWSTGTNPRVRSHLARVRRREPGATGSNFAVSGRKLGEMEGQADSAVAAEARYVTLLAGLNDACRESLADMTSVDDFREAARAVIGRLGDGLPDSRVLVASIPDPVRFLEAFRGDAAAYRTWARGHTCWVFFAGPAEVSPAARARRAAARRRVVAFNRVLEAECNQHENCHWDGGALFRWRFGPADITKADYFHPSVQGEARIAALTWERAGLRFFFRDQAAEQ